MKQNSQPTSHNKSLSILIPTYNDVCVDLVSALSGQASSVDGLEYEILVADDGSTDKHCVEHNRAISRLPNCRYIERTMNVGRACIRNFLAREARFEKLLFIDSHMSVISPDYLKNYLLCYEHLLAYGGYTIDTDNPQPGSLRYMYEKSCIASQDYRKRREQPYSNFHTSNFMISREVMLRYPLDERFRHYGYEDVLYGKTLKSAGIPIVHIDNALGFSRFESNKRFLEKTLEGLRTLYIFRQELSGYSRLLDLCGKFGRWKLSWLIRVIYLIIGGAVRRNLIGSHPSVLLFKVFRLGEYERISRQTDNQ